MEKPSAYRGEEAYAFVCYAHSDSAQIFPLIHTLGGEGANIWYDEGITPGVSWTDELASAISRCDRVLFFISSASISSGYCLDEINYALEHGIDVVCIYLEDVELPPGLKLSLSRRQAIVRSSLTDAAFNQKLHSAAIGSINATMVVTAAKRKTRWLLPAGGVVVLIAAVVAGYFLNVIEKKGAASLLILPFEAISLDEDISYLPSALNNDLISRMSETPALKVIASVSARNLIGSGASIEEMAAIANVENVLMGSIQQMGEQLRINASLVSADDGGVIWSQQFDGNIDDLMAMQSAITTRLSRSLSIRLDDKLMAQLAESGTKSIEAFDVMLQMSKMAQSGGNLSQMGAAVELADRLVTLDPEFADGWAIKASNDFIFKSIMNGRPSDARQSAEKALSIEPDNARGLRALGLILLNQDPKQAVNYLNRAIELAPGRAIYYMDLALALNGLERFDDALSNLELALDLDPVNPIIRSNLVENLIILNRLEDAEVIATRGLELQPNSSVARVSLSSVLFEKGLPLEGLVEMAAGVTLTRNALDQAGFLMKLIQYGQLEAAANWTKFFVKESGGNPMFVALRGRLIKSSGNLAALGGLIDMWSKGNGLEEATSHKLNASLLYLKANIETDTIRREALHKEALTLLTQSEEIRPIRPNPFSDLYMFVVLQHQYGDAEFAIDLLQRFKFRRGSLFATERLLPDLLKGGEQVLDQVTELSSRGLLNLPLLREVGVLGENKSLFDNISDDPNFSAAVVQQQAMNDSLTRRARAEHPELLSAPLQK